MNEELLRIAKYLQSSEYRFRCHEELNIIQLQLRSASGSYEIFFQVKSEFMLTVSATPSLVVPEGSRGDVAVAVNRANGSLSCGYFEINMDSGDLWFRFKIPLTDAFPSDQLLAIALTATLALTDRYLPAFLAVIYGNEPAKDAIAMVESAEASHQVG